MFSMLEYANIRCPCVIRARTKLQLLRNRAIALENAVQRFKARKAGNAA